MLCCDCLASPALCQALSGAEVGFALCVWSAPIEAVPDGWAEVALSEFPLCPYTSLLNSTVFSFLVFVIATDYSNPVSFTSSVVKFSSLSRFWSTPRKALCCII